MMAAMALALPGSCGCGDGAAPGEAQRSSSDPVVSSPAPATAVPPGSGRKPVMEIAREGGGADVLQAQSLLPLARILQIARGRVPGEVIEVELEDEHGVPEYEVKILTAESRAIEIKIDARSGAIRKLEEED